MEIRAAARCDLLGIGRLAYQAWSEAYTEMVDPGQIYDEVTARYTPAALAERLLKNSCVVATTGSEATGFAEVSAEPDRVVLHTLYTSPEHRNHGIGSHLLSHVQALSHGLPICTDVVLGNFESERFFETHGFAPGEVVHDEIGGAQVIKRKWWLAPDQTRHLSARIPVHGRT
jgi:GNAT superfamily N-acetyltransferase